MSGQAVSPLISSIIPRADDAYEANDSFGQARNLGTPTATTTLTSLAMADAGDWYRFTTRGTGGSSHNVMINFLSTLGHLDLELYNASGVRLARSAGLGNQEQISLAHCPPGTYYVHVYGYQGATNPSYTLRIAPPAAQTLARSDLSGASLSVADAAQWGQTVSLQAAVRNSGSAASGSFQVQWYLSRDAIGSSDDVLLGLAGGGTAYSHTPLAAGSVGPAFPVSLRLPSAAPAGWTGSSFSIVMRTDSAGQVAESNGGNNFGQIGTGFDREAISITTATPPAASGFRIEVIASGMTSTQRAVFQQAADRWAEVITGDLPDAMHNGRVVDDLLIDARGVAIDGAGGILGRAAPDRFARARAFPITASWSSTRPIWPPWKPRARC